MNSKLPFTIITLYHFNESSIEAYSRLLRSLRASVREVGKSGRVILVANGTEEDAADPVKVIEDLGISKSAPISVVTLQRNAENVGGLNAGIEMALEFPLGDDEWIGSVQSSVTLLPGWIDSISKSINGSLAQGIFLAAC